MGKVAARRASSRHIRAEDAERTERDDHASQDEQSCELPEQFASHRLGRELTAFRDRPRGKETDDEALETGASHFRQSSCAGSNPQFRAKLPSCLVPLRAAKRYLPTSGTTMRVRNRSIESSATILPRFKMTTVRAHAFYGFEFMGAEQHRFPAGR